MNRHAQLTARRTLMRRANALLRARCGYDGRLCELGPAELAELREIRLAIERIDHGVYGTCARCAGPIRAAHLESSPVSRHCQPCGRLQASGDRLQLVREIDDS